MFLALQNFATFEHIARKKNEQEGWFWKIGMIAKLGADKGADFQVAVFVPGLVFWISK